MEFVKSKYYNQQLLGEDLYENIPKRFYTQEIFTVQEFFHIYDDQKEYFKDGFNYDDDSYRYTLTVHDDYYEFDAEYSNTCFTLVFDKPVHITGNDCISIIAPEIIIKSSRNISVHRCVANKVTVNNGPFSRRYEISFSKINDVYFHDKEVIFDKPEINNFFVFNKDLQFDIESFFLDYHQIKCFGECADLKEKMLKYADFRNGIIHIE